MDWLSFPLAIAGLLIGGVVGLTGMGGGALMTPVLVLVFGVDTVSAISSDLLVSLLMKPFGAIVHLRRRTVNLRLVGWLCIGSVPGALIGVIVLNIFKPVPQFTTLLQGALGIALILAAGTLAVRIWMGMTQRHTALGEGAVAQVAAPQITVRPALTITLGALAGAMVGITSVGAGSIVVIVLLLLYPTLKASQLVGTDLVQAIPLVGAAFLGHFFFGDVSLSVAGSVLVGAIPGAWLGAQFSSRFAGGLIRRALAVLLFASGLALLGVPTVGILIGSAALIGLGIIGWLVVRPIRNNRSHGHRRDERPARREPNFRPPPRNRG
jgi:uncharacterized membrane protein YfcA